ncbi:MAG TPA: potassium-transporting ATPase subunit C [Solirubrobacteraceae bacterium]|nr:potassium-transporting ATPase subunit C [Solirubrobacteraceae bacterium]
MIRELRTAAVAAVVLTLALGLAYPLVMTGAGQVLFPHRTDGSIALIGADFSAHPGLFQSRPSVTGYDPSGTFFNNQGPNQRALADQLTGYVRAYLKRERPYTPGLTAATIPPDAVTASASGVDPAISEQNARIQANRVAVRRGLPLDQVLRLIDEHASRPFFGLAGPKSINVRELNAAVRDVRR